MAQQLEIFKAIGKNIRMKKTLLIDTSGMAAKKFSLSSKMKLLRLK